MNDPLRIIWTIFQLIGAILLVIFSIVNINGNTSIIFPVVRLSFSSLALLLAIVDLCAATIQKVIKCSTTNRHYTQFHNVVEGADTSAAEDVANAAVSRNAILRTIALCTDIARLIVPDLLLVPIVICDVRVSNPKSRSMQNELISVLSSRSTLGMIETTPQIGEAPEKVRTNVILNHKRMYKKGYT